MDDAASAADIAALGRTIRRCTAVLVLTIGIHLLAITPGESDWGLALVTLAGFYLFASLTSVDGEGAETDGEETDDEPGEASRVRSDPGG
ncbi:hypothetical protein I7X12_08100 [Halosimplex litoreum]|uniref:Uncharacterized protein n=1 Tax=Halosimplex litoreum TaxID=1198301 RepID=A0A7U3WAB8_9EURY|nr:hypothetical protein [Halosimplex litoreum]QPV64563.1 hypothetical protein I7X12_08100 [Halosimplex litoreum]